MMNKVNCVGNLRYVNCVANPWPFDTISCAVASTDLTPSYLVPQGETGFGHSAERQIVG